jgi:hypothetical protein
VRITSRRPVAESEAGVLDPAWIVVAVTTGPPGGPTELAMSDEALTGLLAWLEASPPGSHLDGLSLSPVQSGPSDADSLAGTSEIAVISSGPGTARGPGYIPGPLASWICHVCGLFLLD